MSTVSDTTQITPSKSHQRRKAARPQELLDAALTLFVTRGLAATHMEDVAKQAGVSKGTLYLYFSSKDELLKAVVRAYLSEFIVESDQLFSQHQGPTSDLLVQLTQNWWSNVGSAKASGLVLLIMTEIHSYPELGQFYLNEVVAPAHQLLERVVTRGVQRGEFRNLDVQSVVHTLISPIQYLISYRQCASVCLDNPVPIEPEKFIATQIELLLRGLENRSPAITP